MRKPINEKKRTFSFSGWNHIHSQNIGQSSV